MYIGRHFWMAACAALFVWGGTVTAQEADKGTPAPRMGGRPEGTPDFGVRDKNRAGTVRLKAVRTGNDTPRRVM